jgi:YD repeat-containing protein
VKELPDACKVTYKYDKFGRCVSMTDTGGTVRYKYDGFSRLIEVQRDGQPGISYTYDTMDRLKSVGVGKELTTSYSYDFLGRQAKIDTPAGSISYEYQTGQGLVVRTLSNRIRTIWEYRPDGSLQSISHAAKDNRLLAQFTYSYRPDGPINASKEWDPRGGLATGGRSVQNRHQSRLHGAGQADRADLRWVAVGGTRRLSHWSASKYLVHEASVETKETLRLSATVE